jgi:hypothetical protein
MGVKKSPQLVKSKVIGARLNANEVAFVDIRRGSRAPGTYLADLVRADRDKYLAEQKNAGQ